MFNAIIYLPFFGKSINKIVPKYDDDHLCILVTPQLQEQKNPFPFLPPTIWLGDRNDEGAQSLGSNNNNINVNVDNEAPDEWPTTDVDEDGYGLRGPANNFVDQGNFYLDGDLMSPLNGK